MTIVHDPQQHLNRLNKSWDIFQYGYHFSMQDKIYVSQVRDKGLKELCVNSEGNNINYDLAGEIRDEQRLTSSEIVERTKIELLHHLSNIVGNQVFYINLISPSDDEISLWINRQRPTEFNPSHNHSGIFSFVFYASIPEEIRQEHETGAIGNGKCKGLIQFFSERTNNSMYFNPTEDTIFIFESSHIHQVYPFYSDNTRISIAGNIHEFT